METLKYSYGETPEDVIRERHLLACETGLPMNDFQWVDSVRCGDLLTVLDALKSAALVEQDEDSWYGDPAKGSQFAALRISILAALGIEES